MKKYIVTAIAIATTILSASAQTTAELYRFSNQNFAMGTARTAAMAGAYTALGADPAAMFLNPAGLAMYRSSEISVTPSLLISNNSTNSNSISNTKFIIPNVSGIYSFEGFTIGVGFNRLADFAGRKQFDGNIQNSSIGQIYSQQLYGIDPNDIKTPLIDTYRPFFTHYPNLWNAIMAYQTGLVDHQGGGLYSMNGIFNDTDLQTPQSYATTNGALNEFAISGAYNYKDLIYVGVTLGFQDLQYKEDYKYTEITPLNPSGHPTNSGNLDNLTIRQDLAISGFGFNMKIGATVRPTHWLRIGLAYHSPTWMNIRESSVYDMTVYDFRYLKPAFSDTPELKNNYNMRSPSRFLAGIAFTIAKRVIISADYERAWFGNMKFQSDINLQGYRTPNYSNPIDNLKKLPLNPQPNQNVDINSDISKFYTPVNSIKIGVEAQPFNGFFIRAGYSYASSPYKNVQSDLYDLDPSQYGQNTMYSGGLGYRIKFFGIDLAYTYRESSDLPSKFYTYQGTKTVQSQELLYNKIKLHQVLLTLSFKI